VFLKCKMFFFKQKISLLQNKINEKEKKLINGHLFFLCKIVHWYKKIEIFVIHFNVFKNISKFWKKMKKSLEIYKWFK
jgi:hypothetical protein